MLFLQAIWHSAKVICAGLYWLLSLAFLWGGLMQLGKGGITGQVSIAFVACLFLLRFVVVKRFISPGVFNVVATVAFFVFILVLDAKGLTGAA